MKNPLISFVVPSFNQGCYLAETLESLIAQQDPNLEILVIDGGSTDESVEIIRRYEPHLKYWISETDRGQSHALNKGFERAQGQWLGWLNSDDLLLPGALQVFRENIAKDKARQWWIGGGYFIDNNGQRLHDYHIPFNLSKPSQLGNWRTEWFAQPSTFFSRSIFSQVGNKLREDLHYAMDLELWIRFLKVSSPGFIDNKLSAYRFHQAGKTTSLAINGEGEIVRILFEHFGIDTALERVRLIASERDDFQFRYRRFEAILKPIINIYSPLKRVYRKGIHLIHNVLKS